MMGLLAAFGALAGVMSWISGPSRGLLWTANDGQLPDFLKKTNRNGVQTHILFIQGAIVSVLSSLYIIMDDMRELRGEVIVENVPPQPMKVLRASGLEQIVKIEERGLVYES